jgi:hypothetical protein
MVVPRDAHSSATSPSYERSRPKQGQVKQGGDVRDDVEHVAARAVGPPIHRRNFARDEVESIYEFILINIVYLAKPIPENFGIFVFISRAGPEVYVLGVAISNTSIDLMSRPVSREKLTLT